MMNRAKLSLRLVPVSLLLALPALGLSTSGCNMLMPHAPGAGSAGSGTAAEYHPGQDSKDMVRKQEAQSDAITDPAEDQEVAKQEKEVQHALAFALGKEGMTAGAPPAESSSQALAELRAARLKLRIEPVTNASGTAVTDNFVQLKDSFTDRVQALQSKLVAGTATPAERAEVMKGAQQVLKLNNLKMQVLGVSTATIKTNNRVQTRGLSTMLQISGMVSARKHMEMDFSDEDYARVKKILTRQKHWEALAAATMGMLAAYEAVVSSNGDPKALDAIADATLKAFPLDPQVSDDDAKGYVSHLSDNVAAQKAKYEAMMRKAMGDQAYEANYKTQIDRMFAQAAGASSTKSASQMVADTNTKYKADLAKCAAGQQPDPGSLVGPAKCQEARQQALSGGSGGGDDDSSGGSSGAGSPGTPGGADGTMAKIQKGMGVANAIANGDASGALQGAADMFPGDGPISSSLQGVAALSKGDFKGALKSAVGLANLIPGGSLIKEGLGAAAKLLNIFG